jgi:hypothetical protein
MQSGEHFPAHISTGSDDGDFITHDDFPLFKKEDFGTLLYSC